MQEEEEDRRSHRRIAVAVEDPNCPEEGRRNAAVDGVVARNLLDGEDLEDSRSSAGLEGGILRKVVVPAVDRMTFQT